MQFITKIGLTALLFASTTLGVYPANDSKLTYTATSTPIVVELPKVWTEANTRALVASKALEYSVDETLMIDIVECETGHDIASTTIQSRHIQNGIQEQSYGLVQINLPHNPDMTYKQAIDPVFSIDYLAKQLKAGRGYLWSCFTMVI